MSMEKTALVKIEHIYKSFNGVYALKDINMEFGSEEIIGLIGENGAGKSTLMKILAGSYTKDSGDIYFDGKIAEINSPSDSQQLGIGMVYQDTRLAPDLTALENVFLGNEIIANGRLDKAAMIDKYSKAMEMLGISIPYDTYVRDLNMAEKQLIEIAKASVKNLKLLILDEPTSAITPAEAEKLFEILRHLKEEGLGILFISHRLSEVLSLCDRFIVMKDGEVSGQLENNNTKEDELVALMVGRDEKSFLQQSESKVKEGSSPILEIRDLSKGKEYEHVNIEAYAGEIVGIFGISGNGQRELVRSLVGLNPNYTGEVVVNGKTLSLPSTGAAMKQGIAYVSDERRVEGIFGPLSIRDNVSLTNPPAVSKKGVIHNSQQKEYVDDAIKIFNVKCDGPGQKLEELSGGNQQKVVVAEQYKKAPRVCIFNEPTIGVDVNAKAEIYSFLQKMVDEGTAVVVLSSDMVELISISHRIYVFSQGRVTAEIAQKDATEETIMAAAVMGKEAGAKQEKQQEVTRKNSSAGRILSDNMGMLIAGLLIVALAIFARTGNAMFFSAYNISSIALQSVPLILVAVGQAAVLLTGGIEMTTGYTMSLSAVLASFVLAEGHNPVLGFVICLAVGALIGLVNGLLSTKLKLPELIATYAMGIAVNGIALIQRPSPGGKVTPGFMAAMTSKVGNVPVIFIICIALCVVLILYYKNSRFGKYAYAVGSNREAAFVSGVPVDAVKIRAYLLCGILSAFGGLCLVSRIGSGDPRVGTSYVMSSITAAVVGGVALTGGKGKLGGAILGAIMVQMMQNVLNMRNVNSYYQYIWTGALLLLAVVFYYFQGSLASRGKTKKQEA